MDKKLKVEFLLNMFGNECIELNNLPDVVDEETRKAADEKLAKILELRKKIIDLVCE